ncbi:hypothetical protein BGZ60DRAFT_514958 [Tricladium varicosporioides]|nr:hypothetical protein BGZ60DRAFT_514958 [Hymenoscyphus varicosporioides]
MRPLQIDIDESEIQSYLKRQLTFQPALFPQHPPASEIGRGISMFRMRRLKFAGCCSVVLNQLNEKENAMWDVLACVACLGLPCTKEMHSIAKDGMRWVIVWYGSCMKTSEDRNALVVRFVGLSIMKDWSRVWYARKTTFAQDIRHGNAGKHRTNMCCRSAEELKPIAVEKGVKAEAQPARGKKLTGKYWN